MTKQKKWLLGVAMFAGATYALAQEHPQQDHTQQDHAAQHATPVVQIVALDECDPTTFNTALGPDFCKNVALAPLGFATKFDDLFKLAAAGIPDPGWDFEPDTLTVKQGTTLLVTDQGGEPHTFTEVKNFGGGFVDGLNAGQQRRSYRSVKGRASFSMLHPSLDANDRRSKVASKLEQGLASLSLT
jgi:hypothetical protein